ARSPWRGRRAREAHAARGSRARRTLPSDAGSPGARAPDSRNRAGCGRWLAATARARRLPRWRPRRVAGHSPPTGTALGSSLGLLLGLSLRHSRFPQGFSLTAHLVLGPRDGAVKGGGGGVYGASGAYASPCYHGATVEDPRARRIKGAR